MPSCSPTETDGPGARDEPVHPGVSLHPQAKGTEASFLLPCHHVPGTRFCYLPFVLIVWNHLQQRLTHRQRVLTGYLPKFSWMRKLNTPPPFFFFVVAMVTGKELKHQSLPFPDDGLRKLLICLIKRQVVSLQLMLEGPS